MQMHERYKFKADHFSSLPHHSAVRARAFIESCGPLQTQDCAICDSASFYQISEVDRYGFEYPTGICRDCGNVQQYQYYSQDDLMAFYSKYYRDIYGAQEPAQLFDKQRHIGQQIVQNVHETGAVVQSVLEIGTGAGGILSAFKESGASVKGLDFDERYIAIGQNRGVTINRGGMETLKIDEKFDLIVMNHVLEHIVDVQQLMKDVSRHLSPRGMFYVEVPSLESVDRDYLSDLLSYYQNAHFIHFTKGSFRNLISRTGYDLVSMNGEIRALLRYTGVSKPIINRYDESRELVDAIEARYRAPSHQATVRVRRLAGKVIALTGLEPGFRAWQSRRKGGW